MAMKINTIKYSLVDALKSLKRNTTLSFASIITVSLTLFMFGIYLMAMLNANQVVKNIESKLEVSVFLKEDIKADDKENIQNIITTTKGVTKIAYVTKEEALEKWKEQLGKENHDLVQGFDEKNPLPESFTVTVENAEMVKTIVKTTEKLAGVEKVVANEDLVNRIAGVTRGVKWIGFAALILLIPICLFLIGNTIKLAVYSRRREVNIMKYVGATDWFIRWPFIIEGVIIGIVGAIIASAVLIPLYGLAYNKLSDSIMMIELVTPNYIVMNILWIFILSGTLIGGIGSILSIRKFLKV